MRILIASLVLSVMVLSGCAGTGFNKKTTLMPDEVWVAGDLNPTGVERDWKANEITGGLKWKLQ